MSRILCTFPGRFGDLLWALPTVRAISEHVNHPVDLAVAGEFASIVPLLREQAYLNVVHAIPEWSLTPPEEWKAPIPERGIYDKVYDLGYRGWPTDDLITATWLTAVNEYHLALPPLDRRRPWITVPPWTQVPHRVAYGWSDCWFELKFGLIQLLSRLEIDGSAVVLVTPGSRWEAEAGMEPMGWVEAARRIAAADVFLGDCSALHVLAVAIGKPVIILEPMDARWNPIFYPLGMDGPEVTIVRGGDGRPTFDARHCADALRAALEVARG